MMNLFSSFNPSTSQSTSLNWMFLLIPPIMMVSKLWKIKTLSTLPMTDLMDSMQNQFKSSTKKSMMPNMIMTTTIMMMIIFLNTSSMLPMVFSPTAQIMINMSMSIPLWSATIMNKMNNMKSLMAHMTPSSTPMYLTPLMVMIESVSLLIQPLTLAIRLTANITAGHILMTLITVPYMKFSAMMTTMNIMVHMSLTILELGVSFIQAYVFSMLINMYMNN